MLVGVLISTLPHLIGLIRFGEPVYFADFEDATLYLNYGAHAYHNDIFKLLDPVQGAPAGVFASWIQLIPGAVFAKVFDIPPIFITLVYRIFAGLLVGGGAYLFIFSFTRKWIPAVALTTVFLCDSGQQSAHIIVKQIKASSRLLMGKGNEVFSSVPDLMLHWQIVAPALSMAFLLGHLYAVSEFSRQKPWNHQWLILSGLTYGLLFYVYFYFWTAATIALVLLLLMSQERWKEWSLVGAIGLTIGIPAILMRMKMKAEADPEWLLRNAFFLPMEDRFSYLIFPRFAVLVAIAGLVYWYLRRSREKDMTYLLTVGIASLLLLNQRYITGLENHDSYWLYIGAPALHLLGMLMGYRLLEEQNWGRAAHWGLIGIALTMLVTGVGLRSAEATMVGDSERLMNSYQVLARHESELTKIKFKPLEQVAGTETIVSFLSTMHNLRPFSGLAAEISPGVSTENWNKRMAANGVLIGKPEYDFKIESYNELVEGGWNWPKDWRQKCYEDRMRFFKEYNASPEKILEDFVFGYVAIGPNHRLNVQLAVSPKFRKILSTATLKIWERLK